MARMLATGKCGRTPMQRLEHGELALNAES